MLTSMSQLLSGCTDPLEWQIPLPRGFIALRIHPGGTVIQPTDGSH